MARPFMAFLFPVPCSLFPSIVPIQQPERFTDRRQHPQRQAIHLQDSKRVDVVLVPLDEGAAGHGAVFQRDDFAQRRFGDDEAAHVLREVPREAQKLPRQPDQHPHRAVARIDAGVAQAAVDDAFAS
jgi:hypothetical protein